MEETLYKTEISTPTGMKTLEVMQADMSWIQIRRWMEDLIGKHFEKAEEEPRERELEKIAENILQFFEGKNYEGGT